MVQRMTFPNGLSPFDTQAVRIMLSMVRESRGMSSGAAYVIKAMFTVLPSLRYRTSSM